MRKGKPEGFTLIELLITLALFIMLGSIMFMMVVKSKKYFQSSVTRSASRQGIQTALMKIARELRGSHRDFVTSGTSAGLQAFSFISAEDNKGSLITDNYGCVLWQKYVIYYIPAGTSKLLRKEVYRDFIAKPAAPLSASELASYLDGKGLSLSAAAKSITLTMLGEPNAVKLRLDTQTMNQHGKVDTQAGEITIFIYNNKVR